MSPDDWKFFGIVLLAGFALGFAFAVWLDNRHRATSQESDAQA